MKNVLEMEMTKKTERNEWYGMVIDISNQKAIQKPILPNDLFATTANRQK